MIDQVETLRDAVASTRRQVESLLALRRAMEQQLSALNRALGRKPEVRPNRAVILLYHRIAVLRTDPFALCLPPDDFRLQMEYLARSFEIVPLDHLVELVRAGDVPARTVAITFDDGYRDALEAAQVLTALNIPATFFLNSLPSSETWNDSLARVLIEADALPNALKITIDGVPCEWSVETAADRQAAFGHVRELGRQLSAEARSRLVDALMDWSGVDRTVRDSHRTLADDEIRALAAMSGMSIGAHSSHHLLLTAFPREIQIAELRDNRRYLEELIELPVTSFAYPYGIYNSDTTRLCRALGFRSAVTVDGGAACPWDDLLKLPRLEVTGSMCNRFEHVMRDVFH